MIKKLFLLFYIFGISLLPLYAQPANDECDNATLLTDLADWCSGSGAFTNEQATASGFGPANCINSTESDVWFRFVATATDVVITIKGATANDPAGTLTRPEVSLYLGDCAGTINQQECETDQANNQIVELYKGGLAIGQTYFIRVQGRSGNQGTFQLCINSFNPPVFPGSDCISSSVLCDKSTFTIPQVIGAGNDPNEAGSSSCLGSLGGNSESNSTWFSWVAANDGDLTFTLTPLNTPDDLDFVLYELPNGVNNCSGKVELRCMAAGENIQAFPSPCLGPTGLAVGNNDTSEAPGCQQGQNSFLRPLTMEVGKAYALMVNNFSASGNGFTVEFGGSGEILGPVADLIADPQTTCIGLPVTFTDNSTFALGTIEEWVWNFGNGATPSTATGNESHTVVYSTPGQKSIVLTVTSDSGCQITEINNTVLIETCCDAFNAITADAVITDLLCPTIPTGAIDLTATSNSMITNYQWSTGSIDEDINNLALDDYMVTITNAATCEEIFTYEVGAPDAINVNPVITMPACAGGMDGSVVLDVTGGVMPYTYNWEIGSTDSQITNIGVDIYNVTINDNLGCEVILAIDVRELELVLDASVPVVTPPLCFDSNEGSVVFNVSNGTPPYLFDFGSGFTPDNVFSNLNSGVFDVIFRDASGCVGDTIVEVIPPDLIMITLDTVPISCFGADDGIAEVMATGGTGGYTYQWNDSQAQTDSVAVGLMPGNVTVSVTDENGCQEENTIFVSEPDELFINITGVMDILCFGDSLGMISAVGSGGNPGYQYGIDSLNFQSDSTLAGLLAGTYNVVVQDEMGCLAATSATIRQPEELVVEANRDTTVNLGFPVTLSGFVNPFMRPVEYTWSPLLAGECTDCPRTEVVPLNTGFYQVMIRDSTNCTAIDSVKITVNKNRPIYIPNAFSPNLDGNNDYFNVFGNAAAQSVRLLRIYNRWGALMYEGQNLSINDTSAGWDGLFKGEEMQIGVYVYYIIVDFIDGESVTYEGDITIVK